MRRKSTIDNLMLTYNLKTALTVHNLEEDETDDGFCLIENIGIVLLLFYEGEQIKFLIQYQDTESWRS